LIGSDPTITIDEENPFFALTTIFASRGLFFFSRCSLMNSTIEQWKAQLTTLSQSDRAELAHFLLTSLDADGDDGVEAAWEEEVARRVDEIQQGRAIGRPVEEALLKPLTIHAGAQAEVQTAIAYYDSQREELGLEFQIELERVFEKIQAMPQSALAVDQRGTRKRLLKRFPYTVYYVEFDDSIWIVAVAHQKRRPGYWNDRLPPTNTNGNA
jgi:toxin ParE1/3/4